jgi:hypothetical protein
MPSRIEDYALIGDCEAAALVSTKWDQTVRWKRVRTCGANVVVFERDIPRSYEAAADPGSAVGSGRGVWRPGRLHGAPVRHVLRARVMFASVSCELSLRGGVIRSRFPCSDSRRNWLPIVERPPYSLLF